MKKALVTFLCLFLFNSLAISNVIYLEPLPGAKYVNIHNNLILGLDVAVNESALNTISIRVTGSKSGLHTGTALLTRDNRKIIFKPHQPFSLDESVSVSISSNSNAFKWNSSNTIDYSFHTQIANSSWTSDNTIQSELSEFITPPFQPGHNPPPKIIVSKLNNPSPGKVFIGMIGEVPAYNMIVENSGEYHFVQELRVNGYDFKKHPDGTFTYFDSFAKLFYQMDNNYNIIDSFYCGNGYSTDLHEIQFLENKHVLLMSYDEQVVDMSQIVPGGNPTANVIGLIIQELDENKNVVFQWRSWDHFQITDAQYEDLTGTDIDYVHGNAIEADTDGNIMISSRHLEEITKIDRAKGNIIWRLGGVNNQFAFTNDQVGFSHQHDIRRLPNGNITLFDNGNFHSHPFSRAVEYSLDEVNKTATLVWQYRNSPDIYGAAMGNVQRLPNGNTLIGWGFTTPNVTEVTPDGQIALEMTQKSGLASYRAYKFELDGSVSIGQTSGNIPDSYNLRQNYPNPFNPSTNISYSIPQAGNVSLRIYDSMGREVASLINQFRQAGTYNMTFDASSLPSGVYLYRLEASGFTDSKKMLLIK